MKKQTGKRPSKAAQRRVRKADTIARIIVDIEDEIEAQRLLLARDLQSAVDVANGAIAQFESAVGAIKTRADDLSIRLQQAQRRVSQIRRMS
jgi:hypothetical protein